MNIYYRVDRVNAYSEGDTITLTSPTDIPSDFLDVLTMLSPGGLSPHGLNYLTNRGMPSTDVNASIDLSLELFRRSFFSTKPSRYQSVFAWDNLDDAKSFMESLLPQFPNCVIYEIYANSEDIHRGDMSLLTFGSTNLVYADLLRMYWAGTTFKGSPLWEYVIPLPVKVGSKVS
ncbi:hypothetical protein [Escherichia coli]|uniref:hypothetical protein n=1 Tax=Escherichia coli TaxID=562 RepID=UPI002101383C|nr:hypothetical protein [Escherichia coli]MCQ1664004.1 hypothetical protein [Escherichia coli]MEB7524041.1 hypothetical protein [Escherichia coli]